MTTNNALILPTDLAAAQFQQAVTAVLEHTGEGTHTFRAYRRAIADFLAWYDSQRDTHGRLLPFSRTVVYAYINALKARHISASSINQRMAPIRRLAKELSLVKDSPLSAGEAAAIRDVEGVKQQGQRIGHWLTKAQAQTLLATPDCSTMRGLRDRAIIAVFLGAGLRRGEVAALCVATIQQREGRWALVDIAGKHGRIRTVPIAPWVYQAVHVWLDAARITEGPIFRAINKGGRIIDSTAHTGITDQAARNIVNAYASMLGLPEIAPHDLRRTFAKLAHKGGASMEQIQLSLGHASVKTTEIYLGVDQDFSHAPSDAITLELGD